MHTTLTVSGIHCASCTALIKDVSQDFPAIHSVNVDLGKQTVTLEHDHTLDLHAWSKTVEGLNDSYHVRVPPLSP